MARVFRSHALPFAHATAYASGLHIIIQENHKTAIKWRCKMRLQTIQHKYNKIII